MQFRPAKKPDFAIDMTPMIDCVFQLLIFFLLSSSFVTPSVRLELPRSSVEQPKEQGRIVVTMEVNGSIHLNKEAIERERLGVRIKEMLKADPKRPVTLRADKKLEYQKVLDMILLIQQAGGTYVNLAYEEGGP